MAAALVCLVGSVVMSLMATSAYVQGGDKEKTVKYVSFRRAAN